MKRPTRKAPTEPSGGPLCPCKELELLDKEDMAIATDTHVIDLKRRCWQYCWQCLKRRQEAKIREKWWDITMRCSTCAPRTGDFHSRCEQACCPRCGVFTEALAFLVLGNRLPPEEIEQYPQDFRLEYWAVWGQLPKDSLAIEVLLNLRNRHALQRVNRALAYFKRPQYVIDELQDHVDSRSIVAVGVLPIPAYYVRLGMLAEQHGLRLHRANEMLERAKPFLRQCGLTEAAIKRISDGWLSAMKPTID